MTKTLYPIEAGTDNQLAPEAVIADLLKQPNGVSVADAATAAGVTPKQVRGVIDRLRKRGIDITNIAPHTFRVGGPGARSKATAPNPERLSMLRRRKGLSRSQLAKRARVSQRQIQRMEDPSLSSESVREQTLLNLAIALQVEPAVLTRAMPMPEADPTPKQDPERVQIGALIRPDVRLAYALVKSRYGVKATDIINMAPLFFVLLAEGSLAWRKDKLAELEEAAERMSQIGKIAHLVYAACANRIYESTDSEENSIKKADLFGQDLSEDVYNFGYDPSNNNPFADYLRKLADNLDNPDAVKVQSLAPGVGDFPDYEVCCSSLDTIAGDSPRARLALTSGCVQLSDIPQDLLADEMRAERARWLEDQMPQPEPAGPSTVDLKITKTDIDAAVRAGRQKEAIEQAIVPVHISIDPATTEVTLDEDRDADGSQTDPLADPSEGEEK